MTPEKFKPQGQQSISVKGGVPGGLQLGKNFSLGAPGGDAGANASIPTSDLSRGGGNGSRFRAQGAQEVTISGQQAAQSQPQPVQRQGAFQPQGGATLQGTPVMPQAQPKPFLQRQAPRGGQEEYQFSMDAIAPDGTPYTSSYIGVFPAGSQLGAPRVTRLQ